MEMHDEKRDGLDLFPQVTVIDHDCTRVQLSCTGSCKALPCPASCLI